MKNSKIWFISIISTVVLLLSGCSESPTKSADSSSVQPTESIEETIHESSSETVETVITSTSEPQEAIQEENSNEPFNENLSTTAPLVIPEFSLSDIPIYSGNPYVVINDNNPYFSEAELTVQSFESYSELDDLGRCGTAYACVGLDLMPTEERGNIGSVKPSGWHTVKYNGIVDGNYLYNRCHLIGYQLSGENANEKNLITGTRYLNVQGMLPFENMVADYVKETGNHVLYRVTPIFEGNNLLSSGILMEAKSVEDVGDGILFCVFAYNVQPNVDIDYATGESSLSQSHQTSEPTPEPTIEPTPEPTVVPTSEPTIKPTVEPELPIVQEPSEEVIPQGTAYIINTNTGKFHYPTCGSVNQMKEKNKWEYTGTRDEVTSMGYVPCKKCNP